ncbi:Autoimmune regulator [Parasponia andersonii]|uniref:Autoimmune regulator n=1 Tax=Parasponia andersonii TaxID=3476 RepID=A0A2P5DTQ9_PARAD|nr:Autoimmune regulator [Parasponia andersonii]
MFGWLLSVMTGGRCHRRKKMMGRGADGGCGTEERPCPVSRVPVKIPATQPEVSEKSAAAASLVGVDFFSQAKKALCLRLPFDGSDEASASTVPTLPSGLARFLLRQSDSRKRHKKSHLGTEKKKKKSSRPHEKSKVSNIWVETEEYFRDLTMSDIDALSELSSFSSSATRKYFLIPVLENASKVHAGGCSEENVNGGNENGLVSKVENVNSGHANEAAVQNENAYGEKENGVVKEEAKAEEEEQSMEIDSVEDAEMPQREKISSVPESSGGLEWLLGSRNKVCLTTERPSKKRKLLGGDAGLEKVLIASSCDGNSSLCHFCSTCDLGKELNRLVSCSSCQVAVHQKCYGVQEDVDSTWLCTWCKQTTDSSDSTKPCVLCPRQGGALKPVLRSVENDGSLDFAHLFCSHWTPEVYIEDLVKMEPIVNVEAIKETRKKLVCNICKVKRGACVRCSHGSCRTSFHPLCAREASHRMEVWGKFGSDKVELRAFCSKHSEVLDKNNTSQLANPSVVAGNNSASSDHIPDKANESCGNGDNTAVPVEVPDTNSDGLCDGESQVLGSVGSRLNTRFVSGCNDSQPLNDVGTFERRSEDVNVSDSSNFILILKKLADRGRINMEDVASEIGMSPDSLSASLADDTIVPDVQCKIFKWLKNNVHLSTIQKNLRESDVANTVAVKSVPPRRRTKGNIRILNDPKILRSSQEVFSDKKSVVNEVKVDLLIEEEPEKSSEVSVSKAVEKNLTEPVGVRHSTPLHLVEGGRRWLFMWKFTLRQGCSVLVAGFCAEDATSVIVDENPPCSIADLVVPDLLTTEAEAVPSFYIHPDIQKKLLLMQSRVDLKTTAAFEFNDGSKDGEIPCSESATNASVCCIHQTKHRGCKEMTCKADGLNLEQLVIAGKMGILDLSPEDEVEGELIYFQDRLLSNAVAREHFIDNLKCSVAKSLPQEIDLARRNRWDAVLVNQYLCELREAKKQGRKERRHKEAQAVLAAATAAAAASSRTSSFRKDAFEETTHQENVMKLNTTCGRSGSCSQLIPRAKETLQRVAVPRVSLEKQSEFAEVVDFSKEHPRSCDICRRSETLLNPILVCCSCKVAVHLGCYRSVKESTGPWHCELCEELSSSRSSGAPAVNFWEKPYFVAECGFCGGTTGAFRKSSDGQWVHAFCAEWVFESRFKRGQINPVEGMETVAKGVDLCQICHRKYGVCIKCNYGHCQSTFHPSCARSAGFYMNVVKTSGGKQQHKAYCEKHSLEQRAKAETQKHGIEELKSFKQIRVELERLRLLCERIIKREKLKRELVLCSHEILAVKRDHVARSILAHGPSCLPDVSSESVTTSLKGHTDGYKSFSEAIQRSDDITVDSTVSVRQRSRVFGTMDDQRAEDDCTTSHNNFTRKHTERPQFSGKQIPHRPGATPNVTDDGGWRSKSRKPETFEKELVMTSDQASVKNMRLPKGYAYVPADCLSNEKHINQDSCSGEPLEPGG